VEVIDRLETYEEATAAWPFRGLRSELVASVEDGDTVVAKEKLGQLRQLAVLAIEALSVVHITALKSQLRRMQVAVNKIESPDGELLILVDGRLTTLREALDVSAAAAQVRATRARRETRSATLSDRVLEALASGPRRTKEIAERCGCDPAQVSRILASLAEQHAVELVDAPAGQSDRRARWYALAAETAVAA
jgi:CRP-like cAMP-binding protein